MQHISDQVHVEVIKVKGSKSWEHQVHVDQGMGWMREVLSIVHKLACIINYNMTL